MKKTSPDVPTADLVIVYNTRACHGVGGPPVRPSATGCGRPPMAGCLLSSRRAADGRVPRLHDARQGWARSAGRPPNRVHRSSRFASVQQCPCSEGGPAVWGIQTRRRSFGWVARDRGLPPLVPVCVRQCARTGGRATGGGRPPAMGSAEGRVGHPNMSRSRRVGCPRPRHCHCSRRLATVSGASAAEVSPRQ
jgi:hypothetical protein